MIKFVKYILNLLPTPIQNICRRMINYLFFTQGTREEKLAVIEQYRKKYQYKTFVETGTFIGNMIELQKNNFDQIYSIELNEQLYKDAVEKFKNNSHIHLIQGDSGEKLREVTATLTQPAIFWLDGHYSTGITARGSKDCPIWGEFDAIFGYQKLNHLLIIDDARCFIGTHDYPTVRELKAYIKQKDPAYRCSVTTDMIIFEK